MKRRAGALLCLLLSILFLLPAACQPQEGGLAVLRVIDGDTIVVQGGHRVRYIGIDAPEMEEPGGREAWRANQALVAGKRVRLEKDISETDRYGRWLRYVYVDSLLVEAELVRLGYARARAYPPDTRYQGLLEEMEQQAREAGRGLWAR